MSSCCRGAGLLQKMAHEDKVAKERRKAKEEEDKHQTALEAHERWVEQKRAVQIRLPAPGFVAAPQPRPLGGTSQGKRRMGPRGKGEKSGGGGVPPRAPTAVSIVRSSGMDHMVRYAHALEADTSMRSDLGRSRRQLEEEGFLHLENYRDPEMEGLDAEAREKFEEAVRTSGARQRRTVEPAKRRQAATGQFHGWATRKSRRQAALRCLSCIPRAPSVPSPAAVALRALAPVAKAHVSADSGRASRRIHVPRVGKGAAAKAVETWAHNTPPPRTGEELAEQIMRATGAVEDGLPDTEALATAFCEMEGGGAHVAASAPAPRKPKHAAELEATEHLWERVGRALKAVDHTLLDAWMRWSTPCFSKGECAAKWWTFPPVHDTSGLGIDSDDEEGQESKQGTGAGAKKSSDDAPKKRKASLASYNLSDDDDDNEAEDGKDNEDEDGPSKTKTSKKDEDDLEESSDGGMPTVREWTEELREHGLRVLEELSFDGRRSLRSAAAAAAAKAPSVPVLLVRRFEGEAPRPEIPEGTPTVDLARAMRRAGGLSAKSVPPRVPDAPELDVAWDLPAGSAPEAFFVLETCGPEGGLAHREGEWTKLLIDPPSASAGVPPACRCVLRGIAPATGYVLRLRALNSARASPYSVGVVAAPPAIPPAPVAVHTTDASVTLAWGTQAASRYWTQELSAMFDRMSASNASGGTTAPSSSKRPADPGARTVSLVDLSRAIDSDPKLAAYLSRVPPPPTPHNAASGAANTTASKSTMASQTMPSKSGSVTSADKKKDPSQKTKGATTTTLAKTKKDKEPTSLLQAIHKAADDAEEADRKKEEREQGEASEAEDGQAPKDAEEEEDNVPRVMAWAEMRALVEPRGWQPSGAVAAGVKFSLQRCVEDGPDGQHWEEVYFGHEQRRTVSGLNPGQLASFRVEAVGPDGSRSSPSPATVVAARLPTPDAPVLAEQPTFLEARASEDEDEDEEYGAEGHDEYARGGGGGYSEDGRDRGVHCPLTINVRVRWPRVKTTVRANGGAAGAPSSAGGADARVGVTPSVASLLNHWAGTAKLPTAGGDAAPGVRLARVLSNVDPDSRGWVPTSSLPSVLRELGLVRLPRWRLRAAAKAMDPSDSGRVALSAIKSWWTGDSGSQPGSASASPMSSPENSRRHPPIAEEEQADIDAEDFDDVEDEEEGEGFEGQESEVKEAEDEEEVAENGQEDKVQKDEEGKEEEEEFVAEEEAMEEGGGVDKGVEGGPSEDSVLGPAAEVENDNEVVYEVWRSAGVWGPDVPLAEETVLAARRARWTTEQAAAEAAMDPGFRAREAASAERARLTKSVLRRSGSNVGRKSDDGLAVVRKGGAAWASQKSLRMSADAALATTMVLLAGDEDGDVDDARGGGGGGGGGGGDFREVLERADGRLRPSTVVYRGNQPWTSLTDLVPNTLYLVRVRAYARGSMSGPGRTLRLFTPPAPPLAPVIVSVTSRDATVRWYPGVGGADRFLLQAALVAALPRAGETARSVRPASARGTGRAGSPSGTARHSHHDHTEGHGHFHDGEDVSTDTTRYAHVPDEALVWTTVHNTESTLATILDLSPATVYRVRVCGINGDGIVGPPSHPAQFATPDRTTDADELASVGGNSVTQGGRTTGGGRPKSASRSARGFSLEANGDLCLGDVICFQEDVRPVERVHRRAGHVVARRAIVARIIGDSEGASGHVARGDAGKPALSRWAAAPGTPQPPRDARSTTTWGAAAARAAMATSRPTSAPALTLSLTRDAPMGQDPGRELVLAVLSCRVRPPTATDALLPLAANIRRTETQLARCDVFRKPWHDEGARLTWGEERTAWELAAQPALYLAQQDP